jgi:hypothetical protein
MVPTIYATANSLQVYDIRYAAVDALSALECVASLYGVLVDKRSVVVFFLYLLRLYDSMNDDEEEIRNFAAETTFFHLGHGLAVQARSWEPMFARQVALAHIPPFRDLPGLMHTRIKRVCGAKKVYRDASSRRIVIEPSAKERLAEILVENVDLFMVERQNLHVNEVRESCAWRDSLKGWNIKPRYLLAVKHWVLEGFQVLSEHIKQNSDGPLGWTSKQETYTFVIQVINGARVILHRPKIEVQDVRDALMRFYVDGRRGNLHPLLVDELERVIKWCLISSFRIIGKSVVAMSMKIGDGTDASRFN